MLHIGPHKTGTTALQNTAFKLRSDLLEQGVEYVTAGFRGNANYAARAIRNKPSKKMESRESLPISWWTDLVKSVQASTARNVLISGEGFADCDTTEVSRIVKTLGPEKFHVVITLRPLAKILTSQWQQYVQNNMKRASLESFLHEVLDPKEQNAEKGFWRRHRHDKLVTRWTAHVGIQNLTVVVVDDNEPALLMRSFEQLIGLREGTLIPNQNPINRSLTLAETELVRAYYELMREKGFSPRVYLNGNSIRPALYFKEHRKPGPDEAKIQLPDWALERTHEISLLIVDGIRSSGVRVMGDLNSLKRVVGSGGYQPVTITAELAAYLAVGMVTKSGLARKRSIVKAVVVNKGLARGAVKRMAERISASSQFGNAAISVARRLLRRVS